MKLLASCVVALTILVLPALARATAYTWIGYPNTCTAPECPGGGPWAPSGASPSPWSPAGLPGPGDTVTINGAPLPGGTSISGVSATGLVGLTITGNTTLTDGTLGLASGTFHWSSGHIGSGGNTMTVTLAAGVSTIIDGTVEMGGCEIDNAGAMAWSSGTLQGDSAAILRNSGTLTITTGTTALGYGGGLNTADFYNTGTTTIAGSGVIGNNGFWGFHNSGTVAFTGTGTFEWQAASNTQHTLDSGGHITGTGTLLFDNQAAGNVSVVTLTGTTSVGAGATLALGVGMRANTAASGATIAGPGTLLWSGGTIVGTSMGNTGPALTWGSTLQVHMTGAAFKDMTTGYIVSQAPVIWDQGGFGGGDGSYFTSQGSFVVAGNLAITVGPASTNYDARFENRSTFTKTTGAGALTVDHMSMLNYGTITAGSGSIALNTIGNGPDVLEAGSTVGGSVTATAEISLNGTSSVATGGTLELTATTSPNLTSTLDGAGTLQGPGTVKLDGVQVNASSPIAFGNTSNVLIAVNPSAVQLGITVSPPGSLTFGGATTWSSGSIFIWQGNITNSGTFTMQNAGPLSKNGGGNTLFNTGTFVADPGATGQAELSALLQSSGAVVVKSGTLLIDANARPNFVQTAGDTRIAGGVLASHDSSSPPNPFSIDIQGGTLDGAGTIDTVVTSEAAVSPGAASAAGTLTITQTYTQSTTGTLDIGLGGAAAGQFDVLAVGGDVTLAGGLTVSRIGGYVPTVGDTYKVLTSGGAQADNGSFATVTPPTGVTLTATYDPNDVVLGVTQVSIPEAGAPEAGAPDAGAPDASVSDSAASSDSGTPGEDGGSSNDAGSGTDASSGSDASELDASADGGGAAGGSKAACSCRLAGASDTPGNDGALALAGLAAATILGRKRASRAQLGR